MGSMPEHQQRVWQHAQQVEQQGFASAESAIMGARLESRCESAKLSSRICCSATVTAAVFVIYFLMSLPAWRILLGVHDPQHGRFYMWQQFLLSCAMFVFSVSIPACGLFAATRSNRTITFCFCAGSLLLVCDSMKGWGMFAFAIVTKPTYFSFTFSFVLNLALSILVLVLECSGLIAGAQLWNLQRACMATTMQAPPPPVTLRPVPAQLQTFAV